MKKGDLKRRFFIAVFPPDHIARALSHALSEINPQWDKKSPQDYHFSLALPGHLTMAQLDTMSENLRNISHHAFPITLTGISFHWKDPFRKDSRNHVLWARADNDGDNELSDLHSKIVTLLHQNGFRYGIRDISPHITVARPPPEAGELMKDFAKAHAYLSGSPAANWLCDAFYICETLEKSDPRHPDNNNGQGSRFIKTRRIDLMPRPPASTAPLPRND